MKEPRELARLRAAHAKAAERIRYGEGSSEDDRVEQERWDALIDWIETHDLNGTELDPRH